METKRRQSCMTVTVFCTFLLGFTIASLWKPDASFSETENRVLAGRPDFTIDTALSGAFETDYEAYLTDQFLFRNQWIALKTSVERLLLKRESKDIYFAEDGYLIEKHTGVYATQIAERNKAALADFGQAYGEQFGQGHFSVLIVPNAVDILQDKLPPFAVSGEGDAYLRQISQSLPEGVWFDCGSVLREHKEEDIYYRTDHHWKTLGAFYVSQAWAAHQGYDVPELADYEICTVTDSFEGTVQSRLGIHTDGDTIELFLSREEPVYRVIRNSAENGEEEPVVSDTLYNEAVLNTKDKYGVFFGGNEPFLQIKTEISNERKLLVIKDSYANCLLPFLMGEFQEMDVIDLRYTNRRLSDMIAEGGYTDLLILYNAAGFAEDMSLSKLNL